jgi:hypothetical protein
VLASNPAALSFMLPLVRFVALPRPSQYLQGRATPKPKPLTCIGALSLYLLETLRIGGTPALSLTCTTDCHALRKC